MLLYFLIINVIAFAAYGIDKRKAVRHEYRISEAVLLGLAAIGGSAGALLGMRIFHHKTRKARFKIGVPIMLLIHAAFLVIR